MGKNVTSLLEALTFEPIRRFAVQSVTTVLKKFNTSSRIVYPIYRLSIPTARLRINIYI